MGSEMCIRDSNHPWLAERTERSANRRTNSTLGERLDIIRSLESYTHEVQLKRLALEAIAFVTQPARMEELRKVFVEMDKDHSGCISIEEFKEAMASVPDVPAAQVRLGHHCPCPGSNPRASNSIAAHTGLATILGHPIIMWVRPKDVSTRHPSFARI